MVSRVQCACSLTVTADMFLEADGDLVPLYVVFSFLSWPLPRTLTAPIGSRRPLGWLFLVFDEWFQPKPSPFIKTWFRFMRQISLNVLVHTRLDFRLQNNWLANSIFIITQKSHLDTSFSCFRTKCMYKIQNDSGSKHLGVISRLNCVFNGRW